MSNSESGRLMYNDDPIQRAVQLSCPGTVVIIHISIIVLLVLRMKSRILHLYLLNHLGREEGGVRMLLTSESFRALWGGWVNIMDLNAYGEMANIQAN